MTTRATGRQSGYRSMDSQNEITYVFKFLDIFRLSHSEEYRQIPIINATERHPTLL